MPDDDLLPFVEFRVGHGPRAQRGAILAAAQLQVGELEQAALVGSQIVAEAWNLHSGHVYNEIAFLARALDGRRTKGSQGFLGEAREYLLARRIS
jgi:hypothetical protein